MDYIQSSPLLLILGTVLIYSGFGTSPWGIYTEQNIQAKLKLLEAQPWRWFWGQALVIVGGMVAVAGLLGLIPLFRESRGALLALLAGAGFVLGHIFWFWEVGLRAVRPQRFAKNELPGWWYRTYSIFVLLALAAIGAAFWLQGTHAVLGAGLFGGAGLILVLTIMNKGVPPFLYYAMTLTIGLTLLF
jgi:hypothetical protein